MQCPETKDEESDESPNEDDLDYGENHGPIGDIDTNI